MKQAVCDTSAILRLAKGNVLSCLENLFDRLHIPVAVRDECRTENVSGLPYETFVTVHEVTNVLPLGMGPGERQAISLAVDKGILTFITDDHRAFKKAVQHGLKPIPTGRVLILAKKAGHISSVKHVLDTMRGNGEGIEDDIYHELLTEAGEL